MSINGPPSVVFPILNVKLAFFDNKVEYKVSFTRYNLVVGSHVKLNAFSNSMHASTGSHICGTVESIKVKIPFGRSATSFPCIDADIAWSPTVRSREMSGAKSKLVLVVPALEAS